MEATISTRLVYRVKVNTDTSEGRGQTRILGYFLDSGAAYQAAVGQGVMGQDAPVESVNVQLVQSGEYVWLLGDRILTNRLSSAEIRAEALKKLTEEEKIALGLV